MSNLFEKIGSIVVSVGLAVGGFFGYAPEQQIVEAPMEESLGADTVLPIAGMTFYLSGTGISSSATSFTLTSLTIPQNGKKITDAELSDTFYITLEPGSRTRQEIVSCTTVVQNADGTATISGCTRGLAPITPYTASSTLQFAHAGGSIAIFSNPPQLYNQVAVKDNDETITGSWLFPSPVAGTNAATKDYVLSVVTGGTVSYDQIVVAGLAGETVATGTVVYLKASDSRWYKADNDLPSTHADQTLGIAQGDGTTGNNVQGGILTYGLDSTQVGMTGGQYIFLSATAGATSTATTSQILGKAISATTMFFDQDLLDSSVYLPTTFNSTTTFANVAPEIGQQYYTAGETINGATLPVPVFLHATTSKVYAMDADATTTYTSFLGFAVTNATANNPILVQSEGIVDGFTSLEPTYPYFASTSAGVIATTSPGYTMFVGKAIDTSRILIEKAARRASGILVMGVIDTTTVLDVGFRPNKMTFYAQSTDGGVALISNGVYVNGVQSTVWTYVNGAGVIQTPQVSGNYVYSFSDGSNAITGRVTVGTTTTSLFHDEIGSWGVDTAILWVAEE
jgi:hypothetical protein